jgi:hypothetical protein
MKSLILIFFLIAILSCKEKHKSISTTEKKDTTNVNVLPPIDYTKYHHIKYDFYTNDKGDIFEKNEIKGEGEYLDSLMFYGEHPNRIPLKQFIDLGSYVKYDSKYYNFYSKDKNHVYYTYRTMEYLHRSLVDKADIKTFKIIGEDGQNAKTKIIYIVMVKS